MTFGLLCSGQGLQSDRLFALTMSEPKAAAVFDDAREVLGSDPRTFVADVDRAVLYENRISQILCVTQALAAYACLKDVLPSRLVLAGYSVGEIAAWSIAGAWTPSEALDLVRARAELMDAAGEPDDCLAAVRGLDRTAVGALCEKHACEIAIINPDRLFVIGGARVDVQHLCEDALAAGAARATVLSINVASHTRRMQKAIEPFRLRLASTVTRHVQRGRILLSGADGVSIVDPTAETGKLARQIGTTLDWASCLEAMAEANVDRLLELGPGQALSAMARSLTLFGEVRALDDFRSMEGVARWITHD